MDEQKSKWAKARKTDGKRTSRVERGRLVRKYRASGQTQESFAARMGINVGTLRGWLYRKRRPATAAPGPLAAVRIVDDPRPAKITARGAITVRWPQGIEVEVAADLDGAGIARLVRELLAPCLR